MSSETASEVAACRGFLHEAALYGCADEFLSIVVPFLEAGLAAGEPTLAALGRQNRALLHREMPGVAQVSFLPESPQPATAITMRRETFNQYLDQGAQQIRVVGEVPHPSTGAGWDPWMRYEAAVNHILGEFPLRGLCSYDTRTTPEEVLLDVERTHPRLVTMGGNRITSTCFEDPAAFLAAYEPDYVDPLERLQPPTVRLMAPSPEAARHATGAASTDAGLSADEIEDLVLAVNECVVNAILHGDPPVELRIWSGPDRVVVTVSDRGCGPSYPFAGLIPVNERRSAGGLGLWIAHQVCAQVTMHREHAGFTIRLLAGRPPAAPGP